MTENLDLDLLLSGHDPAPARELTLAEAARCEALLQSIRTEGHDPRTVPAPRRRRRTGRILLATGLVTAAAACAAVVVAPTAVQRVRDLISYGSPHAPMFTSAELASWTSDAAPATADGSGAKWCDRALQDAPGNGSPQTVTVADLRGSIASEIVSRAGNVFLCMAGSGGQGFWDTLDPVPAKLADRAVLIDTGGAHGVGKGKAGFGYSTGFAGNGVRSVTVNSGGHRTTAHIQNNRWTAWWPVADMWATPGGDTVTVSYTDGSVRTFPDSDLYVTR
ncbi:hypothetical protein ABUW04_34300 [Streptacidiphilus sp. N1-10]|uniref:Uncharacterized protein n=1 Tax=Streptacidiphilus jeojiensis TaxID=3229225 RepID=A0ABV6XZB9_9ACTN